MRYVGAALFGALFSAVLWFMPGPGEPWPWQSDPGVSFDWQPDPVSFDVILEDDPRWNCATMGNRVCGSEFEPDTGAFIGGYN